MATKKLVREFAFKNATSGALRFQQDEEKDGSRPIIGSLYLTKAGITAELDQNVKRVRVTVEAIG